MHPRHCPEWEYDNIPEARDAVRERAVQLLLRLRSSGDECKTTAVDTRSSHAQLFDKLTPTGFDYYAGHYRGEPFPCLLHYRVGIKADPLVGAEPHEVIGEMAQLEGDVLESVSVLDAFVAQGRSRVANLLQIVKVAARLFVQFLTIHPYANGNGHAGRLVVCALLGRYGFWMSKWNVEPRPVEPAYSQSIASYRRGYIVALEKFILECAKWG